MIHLSYSFNFIDLFYALGLLLAPLLTFFRRTQGPVWWLIPLWLTFIASMALIVRRLDPLLALPACSLLLVLVVFVFSRSKSFRYFRLPTIAEGESKQLGYAKIIGVCLICEGISIGVHLLHERLSSYLFNKRSDNTSSTAQLLLDYLALAEGPLMTGLLLAGLIFWIGISIAVIEEVIFRGLLQDSLERWFRRWIAMLISVSVFGLLHGLNSAIPSAFFGVLASWLTFRYQSLLPAILMHTLNNGGAVVAMAFLIWTGHDDRYKKHESERLAKVAEDREKADRSKDDDLFSLLSEAKANRGVYEPHFRTLMIEWGISGEDMGRVLDLWERATLDRLYASSWWYRETPTHLGDRRNAWRNKAWEKRLYALRDDIRETRNSRAAKILGGLERAQQLQKLEIKVIEEDWDRRAKEKEAKKQKQQANNSDSKTAPKVP